jgi:hypothetical protein
VKLGAQPIGEFSVSSPSGIDHRFRPDVDADGVSDDADDCPCYASSDQADTDGNGRGDVCEWGDQNGDGRVDVRDLIAINIASFNPQSASPLCDANGDGPCNVSDIVAANPESSRRARPRSARASPTRALTLSSPSARSRPRPRRGASARRPG